MPELEYSVVVPVYNAARYLSETLPALEAAVRRCGRAELILADNGSTDGSYERIREYATTASIPVTVLQVKGVTVGALRNAAVRQARGQRLAFVDADCLIGPDYLETATRVLGASGADATGSLYELPTSPHWIEATWNALHRRPADGPVKYINTGNMVLSRAAFDQVGGFDTELVTGEDAELGERLTAAGAKLLESREVRAVHLGNPKTLSRFFHQQIWHGIGMFGSMRDVRWNLPSLMTFVHLLFTILAVITLVASPFGWPLRLVAAGALTLAVPVGAVAYRGFQAGHLPPLLRAVLLYYLYFTARVESLWRIIVAARGGDPRRWVRARSG